MTMLGTHEVSDFQPGSVMQCQATGDCPIVRPPFDPGGNGGNGVHLPCAIDGSCGDGTNPPTNGTGNPPANGTNPPSSDPGNNTNSSSPEFNSLMNTLNSMVAGGAPITPPLQDNNTPVAVPTQTTSKNTSLAIVLFIIAGAIGYYYYRRHGGPSLREAV